MGSGNVGCALAATFAEKGDQVVIWAQKEHSGNIPQIEESGNLITSIVQFQGDFRVETIYNLEKAL